MSQSVSGRVSKVMHAKFAAGVYEVLGGKGKMHYQGQG